MCIIPKPEVPKFEVPKPPPAPPPPPPPASDTAATVKQESAASAFSIPSRKKNPFRIDDSSAYNSGASDSVATGLNIPV